MKEVQIDTLVGPTHFYGGLAFGNVASLLHRGIPSNPKQAALQGLEKMRLVHSFGVEQLILPPHERPLVSELFRLGFSSIDGCYKNAPELLLQISSQSAMWTANAATVTPSCDAADGKVHFTPANLLTNYHRSLETPFTAKVLHKVFANPRYFVHHTPLPSTLDFADEGAANHTRFTAHVKGVHLFVYGKEFSHQPSRYPARQTKQAQQAIQRLHGIDPKNAVFAQQNPEAIDLGVFHNDVIAVGHERLFLYHERAYLHTPAIIKELLSKTPLELFKVPQKRLTIEEAVTSYLFNSQFLRTPSGERILICPIEVRQHHKAKAIAESIPNIDQIEYISLNQSMKNGGGPACLRLRLDLTDPELAALHQGVRFTHERYKALKALIKNQYPDQFTPKDLLNPTFHKNSKNTLKKIAKILLLEDLYE